MSDRRPRASRLAPREVEREALRLFRRLGEPGAHLRRLPDGRGEFWGLFVRRNGFRKPVMRVAAVYVDAFRQRDWVCPGHGETLALSEAGAACHRRRAQSNDTFRAQHQTRSAREIELSDGEKVRATVNQAESPLGWLRNRRDARGKPLLSQTQYEAGERFRADFERAHLMPRLTADWAMPVPSSRRRRNGMGALPSDQSDACLAAKARVHAALDAVGPDLAGILIEVCCNLNGLEHAERTLQLPQRAGKVVLQIALNHLARHYGMLAVPARRREGRLEHWGAPDYRPTVD